MRVRPRPRYTAYERRDRYLAELRRLATQPASLSPRARRPAGPSNDEQRDPRFAELDKLIAAENAKERKWRRSLTDAQVAALDFAEQQLGCGSDESEDVA